MGSQISKESLTTEQLQVLLEELRTMDATVAIIVTASHYEEYVETSEEARSSYKWVPGLHKVIISIIRDNINSKIW